MDQKSRAATTWWEGDRTAHGKMWALGASASPPILSLKEYTVSACRRTCPPPPLCILQVIPADLDGTLRIEFSYTFHRVSKGIQNRSSVQ